MIQPDKRWPRVQRDNIAIAKKAARTRKRMQQARTVSDALDRKARREALLPCPDYGKKRPLHRKDAAVK
jgi:hypothetical protein